MFNNTSILDILDMTCHNIGRHWLYSEYAAELPGCNYFSVPQSSHSFSQFPPKIIFFFTDFADVIGKNQFPGI